MAAGKRTPGAGNESVLVGEVRPKSLRRVDYVHKFQFALHNVFPGALENKTVAFPGNRPRGTNNSPGVGRPTRITLSARHSDATAHHSVDNLNGEHSFPTDPLYCFPRLLRSKFCRCTCTSVVSGFVHDNGSYSVLCTGEKLHGKSKHTGSRTTNLSAVRAIRLLSFACRSHTYYYG